ncbi:MAG: hypothetical protein COB85_00080 [Bacteroidetes bacterium]|nr:MAG: hypothetical protein COB85_00080 [Bacteroidota bacterium]
MNRLLLISAIILATNLTIYGQDTIYSIAYYFPQPVSNFEDRDTANYFYFDTTQTNNIWQIGTPSKTVFNSAYSNPLALVTDTLTAYPTGNKSTFEFVLYSDDQTSIEFWHRFDTDSLKDGGIIEASMDGGLNWTNIVLFPDTVGTFFGTNLYSQLDTIESINYEPGFTGNSDGWIKSTISTQGNMNYIRFRFTFSSDTINNNRDGWMIDNFIFSCFGTGIEDTELNSKIILYPNPVTDQLLISIDDDLKLNWIKVFDSSGQIVSKASKTTFDTNSWTSGLYLIEISTEQGSLKKKFIKINVR